MVTITDKEHINTIVEELVEDMNGMEMSVIVSNDDTATASCRLGKPTEYLTHKILENCISFAKFLQRNKGECWSKVYTTSKILKIRKKENLCENCIFKGDCNTEDKLEWANLTINTWNYLNKRKQRRKQND